jgi:hypothetical protein
MVCLWNICINTLQKGAKEDDGDDDDDNNNNNNMMNMMMMMMNVVARVFKLNFQLNTLYMQPRRLSLHKQRQISPRLLKPKQSNGKMVLLGPSRVILKCRWL